MISIKNYLLVIVVSPIVLNVVPSIAPDTLPICEKSWLACRSSRLFSKMAKILLTRPIPVFRTEILLLLIMERAILLDLNLSTILFKS